MRKDSGRKHKAIKATSGFLPTATRPGRMKSDIFRRQTKGHKNKYVPNLVY